MGLLHPLPNSSHAMVHPAVVPSWGAPGDPSITLLRSRQGRCTPKSFPRPPSNLLLFPQVEEFTWERVGSWTGLGGSKLGTKR